MDGTQCGGDPVADGFVLGVLGAPGGVGASSVATACAGRAALAGRTVVLLDAQPWGGGIEVLAGLDAAPGLRWPDLTGVQGDVDGTRLVAELPVNEDGVRCLSWGPAPPDGAVPGPAPVVTALRRAVPVVVVDLPRPAAAEGHEAWWAACDEVVLVMEPSVTGLGAAIAVARSWPPAGVVVRTPAHVGAVDLEAALGVPVLACLAEDRSVARCLERGLAVGAAPGALAEVADVLLSLLLPAVRAA